MRAACAGRVRFAGSVAGAAPVVTISCAVGGALVTLGRVAPSVSSGVLVGEGDRIGSAHGASVGLSVRQSGVGYVDPVPLLRGPGQRPPTLVVPGRSRAGRGRTAEPLRLPTVRLDHEVRMVAPIARASAGRGAASRGPDGWLGWTGCAICLALALRWLVTPTRWLLRARPRAAVRRIPHRR